LEGLDIMLQIRATSPSMLMLRAEHRSVPRCSTPPLTAANTWETALVNA